MNMQNMQKLADWLDAGAPHVVFHMRFAASDVEKFDEDELEDFIGLKAADVPSDCGTVCCIAGAAYLMANAPEGQMFPDLKDQKALATNHWRQIERVVMPCLGLNTDFRHNEIYGHNLFDPQLAPPYCTPQQAAAAVRRVMRGEPAWPATA